MSAAVQPLVMLAHGDSWFDYPLDGTGSAMTIPRIAARVIAVAIYIFPQIPLRVKNYTPEAFYGELHFQEHVDVFPADNIPSAPNVRRFRSW